MKQVFFLFALSFCQLIGAQQVCSNDIEKYKAAYNYVAADSVLHEKKLYVSPLIVDLGRVVFSEYLKEYPDLKEIVDSLIKYTGFDIFESTIIKDLFSELNPFSESTLYFSSIEKNTLMADLFIKKKASITLEYDWLAANGEKAFLYLFFFDDEGNIKNVFRQEMIYN
ncbi:hypothetical protein LJC72_06430 [Bacteroides sp. OttesenSCG-928-D19]|nr:hypothetical protein [Bacteroides sp. OttesenSCG-928-D19]